MVRPINPGEVVTVQLLSRMRWGAPRVLGVYRLGLQILVTDGQLCLTDTLVDDRNKAVPVSASNNQVINVSIHSIFSKIMNSQFLESYTRSYMR